MGENQFNQKNDKGEIKLSDALAFLGAVLATIGDGLSAIAIQISIEEEWLNHAKQQSEQKQHQLEMEKIMKRLDRLEGKLKNK